jgi:hypothetical protein
VQTPSAYWEIDRAPSLLKNWGTSDQKHRWKGQTLKGMTQVSASETEEKDGRWAKVKTLLEGWEFGRPRANFSPYFHYERETDIISESEEY